MPKVNLQNSYIKLFLKVSALRLLVLLSACTTLPEREAHKDVRAFQVHGDSLPLSTKTLTAKLAQEDLLALVYFMQEGYAGKEFLSVEQTKSLSELWSHFQNSLRDFDSLDTTSFVQKFVVPYLRVYDDANLAVTIAHGKTLQTTHSHSPYIAHVVDRVPDELFLMKETCDFGPDVIHLKEQAIAEKDGTIRFAPIFLSQKPLTKVSCVSQNKTKDITLRSLTNQKKVKSVAFESQKALARVASLDTGSSHFYKLRKHTPRLAQSAELILDLRANPGGNLEKFLSWLSHLGVAGELHAPVVFRSATVASKVLRSNRLNTRSETSDEPLETKTVPFYFRQALFEKNEGLIFKLSGANPKKLLFIVDNGCKNECETLANFARSDDDVLLVGTNTFGASSFVESGLLVLPHSKVRISIPTAVASIGRSEPEVIPPYGILPEIWTNSPPKL